LDEHKFWSLIQHANDLADGDMDEKCEAIKAALAALPKSEAIAFSTLFDAAMDRAYSWSLWAAAYIINGGCGDDTFSDFRASLISRGRNAYEAALANPESLATEDFDEDAWFYEGYQYAVNDGVTASAGSEPSRATPHPDEPTGKPWAEETVYDLFPALARKFAA
jgi:hypothetical protein